MLFQAASGKEVEGVRIGVKNGGCAGMEYTMSYAEARGPHDEVIEDKGVKLLIDPTAVIFLLGTEMDYRADRMRSGFVFNNPNQTIRLRLRRVRFAQARRSPRERRPSLQSRALVIPGLPASIPLRLSVRGAWNARRSPDDE